MLAVTGRPTVRRAPRTDDAHALVEALYVSEAPTLTRARRRSSDRSDALDHVHDAFVRLLGLGPDRIRSLGRERPAAYLWRIAKHISFDHARRDARRSADLHASIDRLDVPGPDVERQLEARDELLRVERAVQAMRPRTRSIFIAHRVDGMSYAEIADACGIGVKGVEKQMSKAIAILAREMDDRHDG